MSLEITNPTGWPRALWIKTCGLHLANISRSTFASLSDNSEEQRLEDELHALEVAAILNPLAIPAAATVRERLVELRQNRSDLRSELAAYRGKPADLWASEIADIFGAQLSTVRAWGRISHTKDRPSPCPNVAKLHAIYGLVLGVVGESDASMTTHAALSLFRARGWQQQQVAAQYGVTHGGLLKVLRGQRDHPRQRTEDVSRDVPPWYALSLRTLAAGEPIPPVFREWYAAYLHRRDMAKPVLATRLATK